MTYAPSGGLILVPVLLYPPFIFSDQISAPPRIALFLMLVIYLSLRTKRFGAQDLKICTLLAILISGMVATNLDGLEGLKTTGNVSLTLVFAYTLSRAAEMNGRIKADLIRVYKLFFTITPICSVISIVFVMIAGDFNAWNLQSGRIDYVYSPFGLLTVRSLFGMTLYRSFFFFGEPVYLGLFYVANVFLIAPALSEKRRIFYYSNILGGVLTFSFIFAIGAVLFFVATNKTLATKRAWRFSLISLLVVGALSSNFIESGSFGDRAYRMSIFLTAVEDSTIVQALFGRGFYAYDDFDRGFSAGMFTTVYEVGLVNFAVILLFTLLISKKNKLIFLFFFLGMLVVEPIKLPFFWVSVMVLAALLPDSRAPQVKRAHLRGTPRAGTAGA